MPTFRLRFRGRLDTNTDSKAIPFAGLEQAYLHVCGTIPDAAQKLLLAGEDPLACAFEIADSEGHVLMDVPFGEILSRANWMRSGSGRRPATGVRSTQARNRLARGIFAAALNESPMPHALVGLDFELLSLNAAGFALTGETAERVLGQCVFDTFEGYQGEMSANLEEFYRLAVRGVKSRVTNLSYCLTRSSGEEVNFWSSALAWPILDDDGRVLAVVNCAVAARSPWANGRCVVGVGHEIA